MLDGAVAGGCCAEMFCEGAAGSCSTGMLTLTATAGCTGADVLVAPAGCVGAALGCVAFAGGISCTGDKGAGGGWRVVALTCGYEQAQDVLLLGACPLARMIQS